MEYPAAHSMDTTWFCVDGAGHVAELRSWEAGAVPHSWSGGQGGEIDLLELLQHLGQPMDPALLPPPEPLETIAPNPRGELHNALVSGTHPRVRDLLPGVQVLHTEGDRIWLWLNGGVPLQLLTQLFEQGLLDRIWPDQRPSPTWYGVHAYEHDERYENSLSGPYVPSGPQPLRPLSLDQLPGRLAELAVPLPGVRLAQHAPFQPVEHTGCRSWQSHWVDLQGGLHSFDE